MIPPVWGEDDYMRPEFEDDPLLQFGKQMQPLYIHLCVKYIKLHSHEVYQMSLGQLP